MRKTAVALGALSMTLAGCFGPPEPVVIPDDLVDAGRTCVVAQGQALLADKGEDHQVTFEEFSQTMRFALAAAAQVEPFTVDTVGEVLSGTESVVDEIRYQDVDAAVPECEARFGIDGEVALPDDHAQAVLSCAALTSFLQGSAQAQGADFGDNTARIGELYEHFQSKVESDPEVLIALISDGDGAMNEAMKFAFGEGAPIEYINQCEARFASE